MDIILVNKTTGQRVRLLRPGASFTWADGSICLSAKVGLSRGDETACLLESVTTGEGPILTKTGEGFEAPDKWVETYTRSYPTLDVLKATKRDQLADRRYRAEVGGFLLGSVLFPSGREMTRTALLREVAKAEADPAHIQKWKVGPGQWIDLTAAEIIAAGSALEAHIAACFANEYRIDTLIDFATDRIELDAIDIEAGWPAG